MNTLQIISIGHRYTTAAERLSWQMDSSQISQFRQELTEAGAAGVVVLQTCNRLEIYVEAPRDIRMTAAALWQRIVSADMLSTDKLKSYIGNTVCMRYMLKVAAGLHSAILGDDQILHQMKKAWEEARAIQGLSTLLERSYQAFMRFHKSICRDTDFKSHSISLAYHTWRQIVKEVHSVHDKTVLIVGAGDMAKQVLKYIGKFRPDKVYLANRTYRRAEDLATAGVTVVPLDAIDSVYADIVINCSPVGMSSIAQLHHTPSIVADLALAVDYSLSPTTTLLSLAQLQEDISRHHQQRMGSLPIVIRYMEQHVAEFSSWAHQWIARRELVLDQL